MTTPFNLEGAFNSEQDMRSMIVTRKVRFDHNPYYVQGELRLDTRRGESVTARHAEGRGH